ncbi:MAG TPA: hypothetical protein VMT56_01505 [Candidatus Bathyarchaeia archaeon]|nr:hypothetical protein [Candidatus Bathyarchaeia archaeon]
MATIANPSANGQFEDKPVSLLDRIAEERERIGARYMPTLTVKQFGERENMLKQLREMLVEGTDYGTIPGTPKPTLYQAGAQKICAFFGYAPSYAVDEIEDWDGSRHGGEPLFYYKFCCTLMKDGAPVGQGTGSCNSWESKYRYRWVSGHEAASRGLDLNILATRGGRISEPKFAIDKAETSGKYGKPIEHWKAFQDAIADGTAKAIKKQKKDGGEMDAWEIDSTLYRVPNDGYPDIINTVQKIAQKRAYVAACLSATGASQYFTQDIEDMPPDMIGSAAAPAPASASQARQIEPQAAGQDDPALVAFLKRAGKGKDEAQKVYTELIDKIDAATRDTETGSRAWRDATQQINGKVPSPEVVRHLYKVWLGVAEPKADYLPDDLAFEIK